MRQTVVGVFDQYSTAQRAADTLAAHGIERDRIQVTGADDDDATHEGSGESRHEGVVGSIRSFFAEVFGSEQHEHMSEYAEAVRRGGAVVRVDVDEDNQLQDARQTLQSAGAVNIDERVKEWRSTGWDSEVAASDTAASGAMLAARDKAQSTKRRSAASPSDEVGSDRGEGRQVLPVVKEELEVGKREVSTGGVRVYSRTVERPVEQDLALRSEEATVERRSVDRPVAPGEIDSLGDRTVEVRETAERPVVNKTAHVVEEVVVGKQVRQQTQKIRDKLRDTEVQVERLAGSERDGTMSASADKPRAGTIADDFETHDPAYREHFERTQSAMGGQYEEYEPAYRYGHSIASDSRYSGRGWDQVEPDARSGWEARNPGGTWDRMKASVRHAWERVTGRSD